MNRSTTLALLFGLLTILACFLPWVTIESKNLIISGMNTSGTKFGKPGFLHLILAGIFLVFALIPKTWSQRANLLVTAVNAAWCLRNFLLLSACAGGECPAQQYGFFLLLIASTGMLGTTLFSKR